MRRVERTCEANSNPRALEYGDHRVIDEDYFGEGLLIDRKISQINA